MNKRNSIYYEFWRNDAGLVKTGFKILGNIQITTGIDTIPTMSLTIPIDQLPEASSDVQSGGLVGLETNYSNYTIRVYIYEKGNLKYKFSGIVDKTELNYAQYTMTFSLSHIVARMRDWVMPSNYVVKNMPVEEVVGGSQLNLGSPSTPVQTNDGTLKIEFNIYYDGERKIETTFTSTNKLNALNEVCDNTEDLHWRVELGAESINGDMVETAKVTISNFPDEGKNCLISPTPFPDDECDSIDSQEYVTMMTEPVHQVDYTNHFNRAVVFCGDVNADVMHLTLKPLWDLEEYRNHSEFPVGMYDKEINLQDEPVYPDEDAENTCTTSQINNERVYEPGKALVYANNDNREYFVTDNTTLAMDGGVVKHVVYNFSDLFPIPKTAEVDPDTCEQIEYTITDDDRLEITKRAYNRAVRRLKAQRPSNQYSFNCTALPSYISDGDKVTFSFTKKLIPSDIECEEDEKEVTVFSVNERIYLSKRIITFDSAMNESVTVTLDENLKFRDINEVEYQLATIVSTGNDGSGDGSGDGYDSYSRPGAFSISNDVNRKPNDVLDFMKRSEAPNLKSMNLFPSKGWDGKTTNSSSTHSSSRSSSSSAKLGADPPSRFGANSPSDFGAGF